MAVITSNFTIESIKINSEGNLHLKYNVTKSDSSTVSPVNYKPLEIHIDNQESFICKSEESSSATKFVIGSYIQGDPWTDNTKQFKVDSTFSLADKPIDVNLDVLFVYIYSQNGATTSSGTPRYLEAVVPVYDEKALYDRMYNILKADFNSCVNRCTNVASSTNVINMYNGFRLALNTGDYKGAVNFWNKLNNLTTSTTSGCNCH